MRLKDAQKETLIDFSPAIRELDGQCVDYRMTLVGLNKTLGMVY